MSRKAANIVELARGGIDVPKGFELDGSHYREAVAPLRAALLSAVENGDAVRELFTDLKLPPRTQIAVRDGLNSIPSTCAMVVRSSGNVVAKGRSLSEDGGEVSLAGQFESFLNVPRDQIHEAVRQCWASLFNDRSIQIFGADADYVNGSTMSVLVQEMMAAAASAVVMTVDPLGDGTTGAIELAVGPCEAIVGGVVSPDEVTFSREDGSVIHRRVGAKEVAIEYRPFSHASQNSTRRPLPPSVTERLAVADHVLPKIIELARRIESLFGVPQDIELVIDDHERITVVQARSITRLPKDFVPFGRNSRQPVIP